jgi:plasmid stability protein
MATLHVRNVPDDLHRRLRRLAKSRNRSLSAEVITLLDDVVPSEGVRREQAAILEGMRRRRLRRAPGPPFVVAALREDRSR